MPNNSTMQSGSDKNRVVWTQKKWYSGQSNYEKEDFPYGFSRSQSVDFRTSPYLSMLPAALKESGSVVTDLVKWFDTTPAALITYSYGDAGNLYARTNAGSWSFLRSVAGSHGNGLNYFFGDDYLYYTTDTAIGRYGQLSIGTPKFDDNFLASVGSVPQNTNSLALVAASSQYATAADSATLSVTGDLTLEAFFYTNTLPAVGSTMSLIAKWDESTNHRSYKMDILGISGFFGDGSDSSLTISVNTTQAPIDSACTGTTATKTLSATNASFAAGKPIFIIQTQGANAGRWERNVIQFYTTGTITTQNVLANTYAAGAQVIQLAQYTNVTVNTGITWTAKAWNGTTGGILVFLANGTVTVTGNIIADGKGYRGGITSVGNNGYQGEGFSATGTQIALANNNGGGGGVFASTSGGVGGTIAGSNDLTTMVPGGGGGAGNNGAVGGNGGGIIFISAATLTVTGTITSLGLQGGAGGNNNAAAGPGAGGSILLKAQTATLGASLITASGGAAQIGGWTNAAAGGGGGNGTPGTGGTGTSSGIGGGGRIVLNYLTSFTGATTPTINAIQDNTLVTSVSYQARLGVSSTGTNSEFLTQNIPTLTTGQWNRLSISWVSASSTATFYLNAVALGATTGTLTAINDNVSLLYIGAYKGASAVQSFFDGLIDDVRIWGNAQTATQIFQNNLTQVSGAAVGLEAYYELNAVATDSTANANDLSLQNTPLYSTNVPFQAATTRLDIDQQYTTTGSTYQLPTAISESGSNSLSFTPTLDPQKSMAFTVSAPGTGNWTLTIHDLQNNVIATQTILAAQVPASGQIEFIFTTPWRIVINKTYHAHLTVSTGTSTIVSSTHNNFSTGDFFTYYQFLVTDPVFHPIVRFLNKLVIGNERYLATWDGASYNANLIAFPPNTHVRCIGFWRNFLAIGTWQETTSGSTPNIYDWNSGKIYFWDGISLTFNAQIDVPEGQVNAILGLDSDLYYFAGYQGQLFLYQGSYMQESGNGRGNIVRRIPKVQPNEFIDIYPQALTMWRGLLHFGLAAHASTTQMQRATYSYGAWMAGYPQALSCDYPISTGNTGSTVSIGATYPVGQTLLQSWNDNGSYGVDQINFNNPAASYAFIEANLQDFDVMWHDKEVLKARADHLPLQTGESITVKYAIDQGQFESTNSLTDSSKTLHPTYNGQGRITTNNISDGRGLEFQIAVEMRQTQNLTPQATTTVILGLSALASNLLSETVF